MIPVSWQSAALTQVVRDLFRDVYIPEVAVDKLETQERYKHWHQVPRERVLDDKSKPSDILRDIVPQFRHCVETNNVTSYALKPVVIEPSSDAENMLDIIVEIGVNLRDPRRGLTYPPFTAAANTAKL